MIKVMNVNDIGAHIRELRLAKGYTQTQLAELSGCSLMFISSLENGKQTAQIGKVMHVLNILGMDIFLEKRARS